MVSHDVEKDQRYTLAITYTGSPQPVPAPTKRSDFNTSGWTTTADGEVWTMQEPYGAYSWYAVNDQPSDKALYDFRISVPAPWVGVANGRLTSRATRSGTTVTRWTLDEPASSYLVTIAIGDLEMTKDRVVVLGADHLLDAARPTTTCSAGPPARTEGLAWLEERLGPFPFDSLGFLIVDSESGMETQTMITLGDTRVRHLVRRARARDGAPVVRRPGHPRRLARRVDERGHGDVHPGRVDGRGDRDDASTR